MALSLADGVLFFFFFLYFEDRKQGAKRATGCGGHSGKVSRDYWAEGTVPLECCIVGKVESTPCLEGKISFSI